MTLTKTERYILDKVERHGYHSTENFFECRAIYKLIDKFPGKFQMDINSYNVFQIFLPGKSV